jgi:hypothetical protein
MLISKPSRRIVSIKIPRCKSPRPCTAMALLSCLESSESEILSATSLSASSRRRYFIIPRVSFEPSLPLSGDVFTSIVIDMMGGSISIVGITSLIPGSFRVCETELS